MPDACSLLDKPCCSYSPNTCFKNIAGQLGSFGSVRGVKLSSAVRLRSRRRWQEQHGVLVRNLSADHSKTHTESAPPQTHFTNKKVVILGGSGRVGASTAEALLAWAPQLQIVLSSRSKDSWSAAVSKRAALRATQFVQCDINNIDSLQTALRGADLVIHTAGPFQRRSHNNVLEAAIAEGTPYIDVADDSDFAKAAKKLSEKAARRGVPAITSAGIYPGTSNVMAAHMISIARREYGENFNYVPEGTGGPAVQPKRVLYSYYTAGSGGVGPTILETSMLLAGEEVTVYSNGEPVVRPPISEPRLVDFGRPIGMRNVWLYNLPEVHSTHSCLRVPSVSARFATAPAIWNWAMVAVARLTPQGWLQDPSNARMLARMSDPYVRLLDPIVGEMVGMLVEVELEDDTTAASIFIHRSLSDSVGKCVGAFALAVLDGGTQPGVWYPEEKEAVKDRSTLLKRSSEGTLRFAVNRPLWALESDPRQIGMGLYV